VKIRTVWVAFSSFLLADRNPNGASQQKLNNAPKLAIEILFLPPKRNVSPVLTDNKEIYKKTFALLR
jgi:hypothetical protein